MSDKNIEIIKSIQETGKVPPNCKMSINALEAKAVNDCFNLDSIMKEWEPYCGRCPKCGSTHIEYRTGMILTSNPPQVSLRCKDCGEHFFSGQIENKYYKMPEIRDPLPGEAPYIGDPLPGTPSPFYVPAETPKQYGWICPKCGRVLAPHMDTCKFCENDGTIKLNSTSDSDLNYLQQELNNLNYNNYIYGSSKLSNMETVPGVSTTQNAINLNEEMKSKFLNESESVFEAVDKYKEWEKNNKNETN